MRQVVVKTTKQTGHLDRLKEFKPVHGSVELQKDTLVMKILTFCISQICQQNLKTTVSPAISALFNVVSTPDS